MKPELIEWAAGITRRGTKSWAYSLDPLAGEIVGAKLMALLGVGAPDPSRIRSISSGENPGPDLILKSFRSDGRLKAGAVGDRIIAIPKIPGAISLVRLRELYGIEGAAVRWEIPIRSVAQSVFSVWLGDAVRKGFLSSRAIVGDKNLLTNDVLLRNQNDFLRRGRDSSPPNFFNDFVPPKDWTQVRRAIAPGSNDTLAIHSARLFLGCSTAHSGNLLVDRNAKLYSIDHERCELTDGREIELLAENIRPGTRAARSLEAVAGLAESDIRILFENLPAELSWPLGSKEKTADHFVARLKLWKEKFAK